MTLMSAIQILAKMRATTKICDLHLRLHQERLRREVAEEEASGAKEGKEAGVEGSAEVDEVGRPTCRSMPAFKLDCKGPSRLQIKEMFPYHPCRSFWRPPYHRMNAMKIAIDSDMRGGYIPEVSYKWHGFMIRLDVA